jgi:predicted acylesterase/phospholipase RssA
MTFKDLKCPLKIVACDAVTMKRVVFDSGRVKDAVMASLSIPGVFVPYQIGARSYIDGGILDPLPTDVLVANGAKKVIAVNVLPSADELERTYELDQEQRLKSGCGWSFFGKLRRFWRGRLHKLFSPNIFGIIVAAIQTLEYLLAQTSAASRSDVVLHPDVTAVSWSDFENIQDLIRRGEEEAERRLWELQDLIRRPV